jgi:hypothetical protein
MSQQTKYFIEGVQAAASGLGPVSRYKKPENIAEFMKGYESVSRDAMVLRFESNPVGKSKNSYSEAPDVVYVGTVKQCNDRLVMLQQKDRSGFFKVYTNDGKPYEYESKYFQ